MNSISPKDRERSAGARGCSDPFSIYAHITPKLRLNAASCLAAVVDGAGKVSATVTIP
jgi:hypothetical protein